MSNSDENTILSPKEVKNKEYVPDPDRVRAIEDRISSVRVGLLIRQPFWGQLASRLELQDATGWCPTAATDGNRLYYNVDFIDLLDKDELKFLLGHEIEHCVYEHFIRREGRDPTLWNCAGDFVINADLIECKLGKMPEKAKGLYDEKFNGWVTEEVYDYLYKNAEKIKIPAPFDMHLDLDGDEEDDEKDGNANASGDYRPGDEHNAPKIGKNAAQKMADEMKNAVISAAREAEKQSGAGSVPGGMARLIKKWTQPQVDWRKFLEARIQSLVKDDYTWMRPNRRGELPGGIILPGMDNDETIKAHIAIDTSGSMSDEMLRDLMGEVKGIMTSYGDFEVHVWCFDAQVYQDSYKVFNAENIDDIDDYRVLGSGGTMFEVNWEWMRANEIEPDQFLLFTDGYPCGEWGDPEYCETIFLVHGDREESIKAPFGMTLYYKPKGH